MEAPTTKPTPLDVLSQTHKYGNLHSYIKYLRTFQYPTVPVVPLMIFLTVLFFYIRLSLQPVISRSTRQLEDKSFHWQTALFLLWSNFCSRAWKIESRTKLLFPDCSGGSPAAAAYGAAATMTIVAQRKYMSNNIKYLIKAPPLVTF